MNYNLKTLTQVAMLTALSVILGYFLKIPTPTGILTLLDAGIFFTAFYLGKKEAAIVGGLSAFLIDLIAGYPQWMLFSLLIHGLQGYLAGFDGKYRTLGLILATIVMVGGYAFVSLGMYGLGAALPEMIPNLLQNLVGLVVGYLLFTAFKRLKS